MRQSDPKNIQTSHSSPPPLNYRPPQAQMQFYPQWRPNPNIQPAYRPIQPRSQLPNAQLNPYHPQPMNRHVNVRNGQNPYLQAWIGGPMPPNAPYPHPNAAAAAAQHAQQMQNATAQQRHALIDYQSAQRRARKPTDKTLPDGIDELLVAPSLAQQYRELRDAERRLDYAMMRKRTDLQDMFNRTAKRQKTMRIWITNTVENQPWQGASLDRDAFDFTNGNGNDPGFRVKIEGRVLDEPEDDIFSSDDEDDDEKEKPNKKSSLKFTSFFKHLTVEFDRTRQGGADSNIQVEWKKQAGFTEVDELAFSRKGDENMNITINLVREENPERFRLSHALAQTLDMEEADRPEVIMGLWDYVKAMGLQEDEEKRSIRCDDSLRQVRSHPFTQIPSNILPDLRPRTSLFPTNPRTRHATPPPPPSSETTLHNPRRSSASNRPTTNNLRHPRHSRRPTPRQTRQHHVQPRTCGTTAPNLQTRR